MSSPGEKQRSAAEVAFESIKISAGPRLKAAMLLAIVADIFQIAVFPYFVEGAMSPADDLIDLGIGALLTALLGWHWEFAPTFLAKLVPGVDMIPCWTIAVGMVYRKSKRTAIAMEGIGEQGSTPGGPRNA
jgi:hypothetical protein